jgi:hypothetical protein
MQVFTTLSRTNIHLTHSFVVYTSRTLLDYSFSKEINKVAETVTTISTSKRFLLRHSKIEIRQLALLITQGYSSYKLRLRYYYVT